MARPKKQPVKKVAPEVVEDQEVLQDQDEVTAEPEEDEGVTEQGAEGDEEPEQEPEAELEAESEEDVEAEIEEDVETPDFGGWFAENLRTPTHMGQGPVGQPPDPNAVFARSAPVPQPQDLTMDALMQNPNLIRQEAARIAQQTMVPYNQALQKLMFDLRQTDQNRAIGVMTENYRRVTREEPLYKNKKFKQALDNSMAFLVQQAWATGNTAPLYNPILPKVIAYALKASAEQANPRPRRVNVRGGVVGTAKKSSGAKGRPSLSPEQEALRKRLGLTYEQWNENEGTAEKNKSSLDW